MMPCNDTPLTDNHIAKLLTEDALRVSSGSTRRSTLAPKPNTRFLKNILREADGHNAALKRKEEQEARDRRRRLARDEERSKHRSNNRYRRLSPPHDDYEQIDANRTVKRRRTHEEKHEHGRSHPRHEEDVKARRRKRSRSQSRERRHRSDRPSRTGSPSQEYHRHRQRRSDRLRSRSPVRRRSHDHSRRIDTGAAPGTSDSSRRHASSLAPEIHPQQRSAAPDSGSDSDPLEALVGPIPPSPNSQPAPSIRGRGRGTFAASNIDKHFAPHYDPSGDAHVESDTERDEWGDAVEAFRDRQKWNRIGAQRLRDAGFNEEDVKKWEKGKGPGRGLDGERDVEDVRWGKLGEEKEWDRGKVLKEDGVETKVEWGRLKGT